MDSEAKLPSGFDHPIDLPTNKDQTAFWQNQNRAWWENNPMRYDWNRKLNLAPFSREFYEEIDRRFFSDASRYLGVSQRPFESLIPYDDLPKLEILEIGVGSGSHAQLLAATAKSYSGIDLTDYAVESTQRRFQTFGLSGRIRQMDAEAMSFDDDSFDFIWTWGVIHHSANTFGILREMHRVLRPNGRAAVMIYHRSFLYTYITTALIRGIVCGGFFRGESLHSLIQRHTDGAIARFYRPREWKQLAESVGFVVEEEVIKGQKSELIPLPASRFKDTIMTALPNSISRFILNTCRQGSFLITTLRKPA